MEFFQVETYFLTRSYLEKSVQLLMEGADDLVQDAQKLHNFQRNNSRQLQQIEAHKAKRVSFEAVVLQLCLLKCLPVSFCKPEVFWCSSINQLPAVFSFSL